MALAALSALAYVPLALIYSPWQWESLGPFSFQLCRPLHYLVYFFAGCAIGAHGFDRGLLASDGALARQWGRWLALSIAGFVLWALPTSLMVDGQTAPFLVQLAAGLGFVIACASGCLVLLALCLRFAAERARILDSLSVNAYGIYLVHYVFIVWLQFLMLPVALFCPRQGRGGVRHDAGAELVGGRRARQHRLGPPIRAGQALAARKLQRSGAGQFGQAGRFTRVTRRVSLGQMRAG